MEEQMTTVFETADTQPKKRGRGTVLLVQSVCCTVLIVLFWLFRVLGGESFASLKTAFYTALENNALMETVVGVFADGAPDETEHHTTAVTTGTNAQE